MESDKALDVCGRQGILLVNILDEDTEQEIEYECEDVLMEYDFFNSACMRSEN
jgi:hypothetical protein